MRLSVRPVLVTCATADDTDENLSSTLSPPASMGSTRSTISAAHAAVSMHKRIMRVSV